MTSSPQPSAVATANTPAAPAAPPRRPLVIGLMGAPLNTGNRGVSALGASTVRLLSQARPGSTIRMLVGNRDAAPMQIRSGPHSSPIGVVNYRLSPRAPWREQLACIVLFAALYRLLPFPPLRKAIARAVPWIAAARDADLVADIRGGDSFSDIYGMKRFGLASLAVMACLWVKGSITLLPQTYGPFKSRAARWIARYLFNRAALIYSRDSQGLQEVSRITRGRRQARFCPDVAFALEPLPAPQTQIVPPLPNPRDGLLIGLNVNGLMYHGGYNRANMFNLKLDYPAFVRALAEQLLAHPHHRLLLVPHTFAPPGNVESDPAACEDLLRLLPPDLQTRTHIVRSSHDQHEIKWVIGHCDFFIGSRMHACIAALSQGIPTVGVAYSLKFSGVFASVGADAWVVDGRDQDVPSATRAVLHLLQNRDSLQRQLAPRVHQVRQTLADEFAALLDRADSQPA